MEHELKEHRTRQRVKLLSSGFHGITAASGGCDTIKEREDGAAECASALFLGTRRDPFTIKFSPCTCCSLHLSVFYDIPFPGGKG